MTLDNRCMYAAFGEPVQKAGRFIIHRNLKSCADAFEDAKSNGLSFAILFADASYDSSTLVSWSIVSNIHFDGNQTTVEFSPATPLTTPASVSKLKKAADGESISTGIRRGQILCDTSSFLKRIILDKQLSPEKPRAAVAYLFLWNPKKDSESFEDYDQVLRNAASGKSYTTRWICPSIKPKNGDLAIVQRTGTTNNGVFAKGHVTHAPFDDSGTRVVGLKLDSFLPIGSEISRMEIVKAANYKKNWTPMASGNIIPDQLLDAIQSLWAARSGRSNTEQVPASKPNHPPVIPPIIHLTPVAFDIKEPLQPDRVKQETYRILRDTSLARSVKEENQYRCQLCGAKLELNDKTPYAEAHHVKPLGAPHNGPDVRQNILCVCPNHHVLLDYGAIQLDESRLAKIEKEYIRYHNGTICKKVS